MRSICDNFTLKIGNDRELTLEDGRFLYLKAPDTTRSKEVEVFMDALEELEPDDHAYITETLHDIYAKVRALGRYLTDPPLLQGDTVEFVERPHKEEKRPQYKVQLIQVNQQNNAPDPKPGIVLLN